MNFQENTTFSSAHLQPSDIISSDLEESEGLVFSSNEDSSSKTIVDWREITDICFPKMFQFEPKFPFELPKQAEDSSPIGLFKLFFDEDIWSLWEIQSNLYLSQLKKKKEEYLAQHKSSRINKWSNVSRDDLMRWLAARLLIPIHSNSELKSIKFSMIKSNF